VETEGGSPHHQAQLRSSVSLPKSLQWNTSAYFVDRLSAVSIPSYTRLDSGLTWRAGEHFSISVEGQDLIKALHPEYAGPNSSLQSGLVRRGGYAKAMWSF
jgi:iron complex outermembrane receptor protein